MTRMTKFCVFCGKPPTDKNKEHVVPRWLITLTGDPNRNGWFGFKMSGETVGGSREFAFDQFVFPACSACNSKYSALEVDASRTMSAILAGKPVLTRDLSRFLDWFDKVRVGLWLGMQLLEKNYLDIDPQFHIERRIGQYDRLLIVEKSDWTGTRLNFGGSNTVSFGFMPSAFTLTVNNYYFTNVSYSFLIARRLGFPFPVHMKMVSDRPQLMTELKPSRARVMLPVIQRPIAEKGTVIYQPMFAQDLMSERSSFYEDDYVLKHSLSHGDGVGAFRTLWPEALLGRGVRGDRHWKRTDSTRRRAVCSLGSQYL